MQKLVYSFNEGSKDMKNLLGDKGANLSEMTKIGLRVPFGFIVTTEACNQFYAEGEKLSENLISEIESQIEVLENVTGKKFGDRENPLLVSVRSSAEVPMTGMMDDTILNLGLNDDTVASLAEMTNNSSFAFDSYKRLIQMYGITVMGLPKEDFNALSENNKDDLETVIDEFKAYVYEQTGRAFPQDPKTQLLEAIQDIFRFNHREDGTVTAVTVQAMVFGNKDSNSATGIAFSRNPETGKHELFGRFLLNAQGEDVETKPCETYAIEEMAGIIPEAYKDLQHIADVLEQHYKDIQRIEFTVENNRLYILQTGTAARSIEASLRSAVDMVGEGLISKETAVERISPKQIEHLLSKTMNDEVLSEAFLQIMTWADDIRSLKVRTNIDSIEELKTALAYGAEGIGLCRTEHMFYETERFPLIRKIMQADNAEEKQTALDTLFAYQKSDFKAIYEIMEDKPVTIRLLDLARIEDFPHADDMQEFNPLLGHRGCRLAMSFPEIAQMQIRSIIEAAIEVNQERGLDIVPEIMIPMVSTNAELAVVKFMIKEIVEDCKRNYDTEVDYFVGTMIELPRAAMIAGEIAKEVDFFSFGTNDLTQMVFGLSRIDTEDLIESYIKRGIFVSNPFETIDKKGVGMLMETAVKSGKQAKSALKIGICGEHGGDPASIAFCHALGLNYVSCSPVKVPIAKISAAQAAIQYRKE